MSLEQLQSDAQIFHFEQKQVALRGVVSEALREKENSYKTIVKVKSSKLKPPLKLLLYLRKCEEFESLKPGDEVVFKAYINEIKNSGNPGAFNYKRHMFSQGIAYSCYCNIGSLYTTGKKFHNVFTLAEIVRGRLLSLLQEHFDEYEPMAVTAALVLGYKDTLSPDLRESFSNSGAQHILAVSGLHVGIVYLLLSSLLRPLKKKYQLLQLIFIITVLWGYAFITGASPSVVRATFMFSAIAIGKYFKRYNELVNILAFTAFVFLIFNPLLLYNISFQLSFIALAGIVVFFPFVSAWWEPSNVVVHKLWSVTALSLSVQLALFPLLLYKFHQFPVYFWLSNLLVIYLTTAILSLAFMFYVVSTSVIGPFVGNGLEMLSGLLIDIAQWVESLPLAVIGSVKVNQEQLIILYILIALLFLYLVMKKRFQFILAIICSIILIALSTVQYKNSYHKKLLVVFHSNNDAVLGFVNGKEACYVKVTSIDTISARSLNMIDDFNTNFLIRKSNVYTNGKVEKSFLHSYDQWLYQFLDQKILWLNNMDTEIPAVYKDEVFQYLIVSNNLKFTESIDVNCFRKVIVSANNNYRTVESWERAKQLFPNIVHVVETDGAYLKSM